MNSGLLRGLSRRTHLAPYAATLVVAASNASPSSILAADYVCDGFADELEINAALAALPSVGGRVVLTEGFFSINGQIVTAKANSTLEGMGLVATTIQAMSGSAGANTGLVTLAHALCEVRNLTVDGNKSGNNGSNNQSCISTGSESYLENVRALNCPGTITGGFNLNGANPIAGYLVRCIAQSCSLNGFFENSSGFTPNILIGCRAVSNANGFNMSEGILESCIATANTSWGFRTDGSGTIIYNGCWSANNGGGGSGGGFLSTNSTGSPVLFSGCEVFNCTGFAFSITGGLGVVVRNCLVNGTSGSAITTGIDISGGSGHSIMNNSIIMTQQHGIRCAVADCQITDNHVQQNGQATNNTYDGIQLTATAARCNVQGNLVRAGALANRQRYGINVIAGGLNNQVMNNDARGGGLTGDIFDGGTMTIREIYDYLSMAGRFR